MHSTTRETLLAPALAAVGAAALGWIARLPGGVGAAIESSATAPAVVIGVGVALGPALYIALALSGAQTDIGRFARGIRSGLRAVGLAALGFAGPLLFLVATTRSEGVAFGLGVLAIAVAMIVGLVALSREAVEKHTGLSHLAFVMWSLAALAVGARLFLGMMMVKS